MAQALLHKGSLCLLQFGSADSCPVCDSFLTIEDKHLSVGEILGEGSQVFGQVLGESSLLDPRLCSESPVLVLDHFESLLDNLCVGADVDGVNSVGKILDLDLTLGRLQQFLVELVFECGNQFLCLGRFLIQTAQLDLLAEEIDCFLCFG